MYINNFFDSGSLIQFWPILCSIVELPRVPPLTVGIYCGVTKPYDVERYLRPFVTELQSVTKNGIVISNYQLNVGINCFICDSPARAFLLGNIPKIFICK